MGKIGNDKANEKTVNALIAALQDEDGYVRKYAAEALKQIGNPVCLENLLQSAKSAKINQINIDRSSKSHANSAF